MFRYLQKPNFTEEYKPVSFPEQHNAHVTKYRMHCLFQWFIWDHYIGRVFRELKEIPIS